MIVLQFLQQALFKRFFNNMGVEIMVPIESLIS